MYMCITVVMVICVMLLMHHWIRITLGITRNSQGIGRVCQSSLNTEEIWAAVVEILPIVISHTVPRQTHFS